MFIRNRSSSDTRENKKISNMPTKSKYYSADEYDSPSDIENTETLISRNQAPRHQNKKKVIKAQRAKRPESTNNSMSGLRRMGDKEMAYLSTSNYLRQKTGREKTPKNKHDNPTTKPPSGTPAYKSPEEYYDQILELKKQIQGLHQDNSALKAKEKEIEGLLDPTKSEELRRTLGDKRSDSGSVIHSLKQKILKLETQLKDKETSYSKLQSDLKATKIEEMKVQLETCFQEIVRLQMSKDTGVHKSNRPTKDSTGKVKALNETVLRLNKLNEQLQIENQSLRKDLNRELDDKGKETSREYEDMNRKQLLGAIKKLEKKLHVAEKKSGDTDSLQSYNERMDERQGKHKIALEGSTEERLESLDKRETQLLDELQKQKDLVKRLQEDKASYRKKKEIQALQKELNDLQSQLNVPLTGRRTPRSTTPRRPSSRPPSGRKSSVDSTASEDRRQKEVEKFREDYAAKKIQQKYKSFRKARDEHETELLKDREENERKIQEFRQKRSALAALLIHFDSTEDDEDEDVVSSRYKSSAKRPSSGGITALSSHGGRPSSGSGRKSLSGSYGSRPGSAGRQSTSGSISMRPGSARSRTSSGGKIYTYYNIFLFNIPFKSL
ncbi:hypothetical protein KUTeg_004193 [Tegillarca granosa]|uniref:Uncharacterized protein n=1 Tax=Tegillarca granosa TaxID=220873 RepID=A0ABQ9FP92_TEGGR|nr:hypothetical protein KUTeg_004193 [Tegillarca granosa]